MLKTSICSKDDRKGLCLLSKLQLNRSRHTSIDSVGKMKALSNMAKINGKTPVGAGMTNGRHHLVLGRHQ
jgi:hypothetical protein